MGIPVSEFRAAVDAFMKAPKVLVLGAGTPKWQPVRDRDTKRLRLPLEVDGEQHGPYIFIDAMPNHETIRFHLGLNVLNQVVCRMDIHQEAVHGNSLAESMNGRIPSVVRGPHWHRWELNSHLFRNLDAPQKLKNAEPFTKARQFDAILRCFCGERNISVGAHSIELPPRERLL